MPALFSSSDSSITAKLAFEIASKSPFCDGIHGYPHWHAHPRFPEIVREQCFIYRFARYETRFHICIWVLRPLKPRNMENLVHDGIHCCACNYMCGALPAKSCGRKKTNNCLRNCVRKALLSMYERPTQRYVTWQVKCRERERKYVQDKWIKEGARRLVLANYLSKLLWYLLT